VVRGGAFNNNERNARCAYRNNRNPNNDNRNNGFRVLVGAGGGGHIFYRERCPLGSAARRKCQTGPTFLAEAKK